MEDQSIIGLPEISELILQHLDAEDRQEAALVSLSFYYTICRLKQNQTLVLNDRKVMDDEIFESMMATIRKFQRMHVTIFSPDDELAAERTVAIAEKFKGNIKSLVVSFFPERLPEIASSLLNTLADVEELTLLDFRYNFFPKKEFRNLRKLSVYGFVRAAEIFVLVPDDSLESLTVKWPMAHTLNQSLQTFVNRQRKLKKLDIADGLINIEHLALNDLSIRMESNSDPTRLKNQTELRRLNCGKIGSVAFEEVLRMRNLEYLCASFFEEVTGELINLKELDLRGEISILRRVRLPKLEKLTLGRLIRLKHEDFTDLSRGSPKVQCIGIQISQIHFLSVIIDNFPALKTLFVNSYPSLVVNGLRSLSSQKNHSLEELFFCGPGSISEATSDLILEVINACPNVKRIQLNGFALRDAQILRIVQKNPQLAHLCLGDKYFGLFIGCYENGSMNPTLMKILDTFRDSPNFVSLSFWDSLDRRFEHYLPREEDRIIVTRTSKTNYRQFLRLTKKSHAHEKFERRFGNDPFRDY